MDNIPYIYRRLMNNRHIYSDDELMELLSLYDDIFSYNQLAKITMRDKEDIRLIYDDMTYAASKAYEKGFDFNTSKIVCNETGESYKNYLSVQRKTESKKAVVIGACLYGFPIKDKHYSFAEEI